MWCGCVLRRTVFSSPLLILKWDLFCFVLFLLLSCKSPHFCWLCNFSFTYWRHYFFLFLCLISQSFCLPHISVPNAMPVTRQPSSFSHSTRLLALIARYLLLEFILHIQGECQKSILKLCGYCPVHNHSVDLVPKRILNSFCSVKSLL